MLTFSVMPANATPYVRPTREILPRVPPYSGEYRELYPLFRSKLQAKFEVDGPALGSERNRVFYGYFCLTDKAAMTFQPWIDAYRDKEEEFTVEKFFKQLDRHFADFGREEREQKRLENMRQGNRDAHDFLSDFDRTLHASRSRHYPDDWKKYLLRQALNQDLVNRMLLLGSAIDELSYDELLDRLRKVTDKLAAWDEGSKWREPSRAAVAQQPRAVDEASRAV